jgi:hypothetical protein
VRPWGQLLIKADTSVKLKSKNLIWGQEREGGTNFPPPFQLHRSATFPWKTDQC